jgi:hypothetical protein
LAHAAEAWLVGSAAAPGADLTLVRDFDLLVPFHHWVVAAMLIPSDAKPNMFGGWKFINQGNVIDVWPGDLNWLLLNKAARYALHIRSGTRIGKIDEPSA